MSNPWVGLRKSRKACVFLADVLFSIIVLCVTEFVAPDRLEFFLALIALLQAGAVTLIGSIAYEDGKAKASGVHYIQMEAERAAAEDDSFARLAD